MEPTKRCPYCAEEILAAAIKCKHCGTDLSGHASAKLIGDAIGKRHERKPMSLVRLWIASSVFGAIIGVAAGLLFDAYDPIAIALWCALGFMVLGLLERVLRWRRSKSA